MIRRWLTAYMWRRLERKAIRAHWQERREAGWA